MGCRRVSLALFQLLLWTISVTVSALTDEGLVLVEFGRRLNDTRGSLRDWDSSHSSPCGWTGVTCSKDLHVVSLNLSGKELEGSLTLDVTRLVELQVLNLSSNGFQGGIPALWGNSASLRILDVSNNRLTGEIPLELERLSFNLSFLFDGNGELCGNLTGRACRSARSLLDSDAEAPAGTSEAPSKQLSTGEIVAICISAFVISKITLFSIWCCRRRKMRMNCEVRLSGGRMIMFQLTGQVTPLSKAVLSKTLKLKPQDIIGSGGYGTVYKLVLDDESTFAVKKLTKGGLDRNMGFENELQALADVRHKNLVTLRGYYSAPEINLLIYDLMPNGNLETVLHDHEKKNAKPIGWELRVKIALGVARGLSYLHHDCIPHIIHRDIKCSNILLDANMEAHVADFGLAKFISPHETHVTTMAAGTLGYLPPEYIETGKITKKGDVYSFGIVVLELLTGKRPNDDSLCDYNFNIVEWANALLEDDRPEDIFDESMLGAAPDEDLLMALSMVMHCTDEMPKARPNMQHCVKILERLSGEEDAMSVCSSRTVSGSMSKVKYTTQISVHSCPATRVVYPCDAV